MKKYTRVEIKEEIKLGEIKYFNKVTNNNLDDQDEIP